MKQYLEGIGLLLGMIIGAGIFGLPYAIYSSGIFWGLAHFIIALSVLLLISLLYGEVTYLTAGKHRFAGYVGMYLGPYEKYLSFFLILFGNYGGLLVYGILGGVFLHNIFSGAVYGEFWFSMIFFAFAALTVYVRFEKAGMINFYLTIPLLAFIIYLAVLSGKYFDVSNLHFDMSLRESWFTPYGVWLFALSGFTVLPEVRDVMQGSGLKAFKRVIWVSTLIAAAFSLLFALAVAGATGAGTTEEALRGLATILGTGGVIIGSVIGLLAVFTSYVATAEDFKELFISDYGFSKQWAWLFAVVPSIIIYFVKVPGLTDAFSFLGAVSFGVGGVFILRMSEKISWNKEASMSRLPRFIKFMIAIGITAGSLYEIWRTFF
jgi:amino acid permease